MEREQDLKTYIRSLCLIYYNKKGQFYKDNSIRRLIDKAKSELIVKELSKGGLTK